MANSVKSKPVPAWVALTSAGISAFGVAPIELVSTRSKLPGAELKSFQLMRSLIRSDGVQSLWKGSGWFVGATTMSRGIWMFSYEYIRSGLLAEGYSSNSTAILAGFSSGVINAAISNPIWTIKTYAQLEGYPGLFRFGSAEYRRQILTPRVFTAGIVPAMAYIGIESAGQWIIYESLKSMVFSWNRKCADNPLVDGLIGGMSRIAILPVSYPFHMITFRYREAVQPRLVSIDGHFKMITPIRPSFQEVVAKIARNRAWYDGSLAYASRVAPQAALLFFCRGAYTRLME